MRLGALAAKNLRRNKLRSVLTIGGVAVALLAFATIRTVVWAWSVQSTDTSVDRIFTRHKVTFVMTLPKRYVDQVRGMKEVRAATWGNWFGGKSPNHENQFFATIACDPKTPFQVFDDMETPPDQAAAFLEERQGALVGEALMKRLGWELGQTITLESQIFPGDWEFKIVAVYRPLRKSVDPAQVFFNWEVLNERVPARLKNQVGWIVARVAEGVSAADASRAIDLAFDSEDIQTISMDERSFQRSFMAMFDAIFTALDIVSLVVLGILMLILGNTVAMGVRERTGEYAVMRAIGFLPRHLVLLVVVEAAFLGLLGGAVGLGLAYPFINVGLARFIGENFGQIFPFFALPVETAGFAMGLAIALGAIASVPPAVRAYRLHVVEALRQVV